MALARASLAKAILSLLAHDWVVGPSHVYIEANGMADWLASQAFNMDWPGVQLLYEVPSGCLSFMFADVYGSTTVRSVAC